MEDKAARFTILIDADKKKAFDELCASQDVTSSQMIRQLIKDYLDRHGVESRRARCAPSASARPGLTLIRVEAQPPTLAPESVGYRPRPGDEGPARLESDAHRSPTAQWRTRPPEAHGPHRSREKRGFRETLLFAGHDAFAGDAQVDP
jgi:hypothetical protein